MKLKLSEVLTQYYPTAKYCLYNNDYERLHWMDPETEKPTKAELGAYAARFLDEKRMELIREKRNKLIADTDWTQLPDAIKDTDNKKAWAEYRQGLRDITKSNKCSECSIERTPGPGIFSLCDDCLQWPTKPK